MTYTQDLAVQLQAQGPQLKHLHVTKARPLERMPNTKGNLHLQRKTRHVLKFTKEEDDFLKEGITQHGFGQWTAILRDPEFRFQDGRTADSLKKRAHGMKLHVA